VQSTKTELEESLHQFVTTWRLLARPFPQVDLSDKPGLAVSWPSTDFPFYNIVFLTEELKDEDVLRDRVREAATHLRTSQTPGLFLVCPDRLSGAAENNFATILEQEELVSAIPMTGMAGDILPLAGTPHPELRFVRISDNDTIRMFAEINCAAYGIPAETAFSLVHEHTFWKEHAYGFLAFVGDEPVATATAIINENCIFLFLVATMPEAQRKGYGNAVVRHALNAACQATGIRRSVLHATEAGYPVYLRLGYHPTGKFIGCMLKS